MLNILGTNQRIDPEETQESVHFLQTLIDIFTQDTNIN